MFPWILCSILFIIILVLAEKNRVLQKSIDEICISFKEHLSTDTNTLISLSSNNSHVRKMATEINIQLRLLRKERQRFQTGDKELKEAVTNISHDLRTPLTAIYGYLDLLEKEEKSEVAERYLAIIKNRVEALKQLTEELFRYSVIVSSLENIDYEMVSLNSALEECISSYYLQIKERNIEPEIIMPAITVKRNLDKNFLSRILGNIISNAVKYSDGDLKIILSETGKITFTNTATDLDEIQVAKLFDRFYTVDSARKSTGLGLSIAKILVEQMNGDIYASYNDKRLSISIEFLADTKKAE